MENFTIKLYKDTWIPSRPWNVTLIEPDGHKIQTYGFKTKKSAILRQIIVWRDMLTSNEPRHINCEGFTWHDVYRIEREEENEKGEIIDSLRQLFENKGPMD